MKSPIIKSAILTAHYTWKKRKERRLSCLFTPLQIQLKWLMFWGPQEVLILVRLFELQVVIVIPLIHQVIYTVHVQKTELSEDQGDNVTSWYYLKTRVLSTHCVTLSWNILPCSMVKLTTGEMEANCETLHPNSFGCYTMLLQGPFHTGVCVAWQSYVIVFCMYVCVHINYSWCISLLKIYQSYHICIVIPVLSYLATMSMSCSWQTFQRTVIESCGMW